MDGKLVNYTKCTVKKVDQLSQWTEEWQAEFHSKNVRGCILVNKCRTYTVDVRALVGEQTGRYTDP